ncbi:MAG: hypothetical protein IJ682_06910 [Lachnospiraceae bacterium]|nr:hypothetical protein [Lachnospiraceae bacterium]
MTIEITHTSIENHTVRILANDVSEEHYQRILRTRDDFDLRELEFVFDLEDMRQNRYLYRFLKRQKAVQNAQPKYLHEALHATLGTVTNLSGTFINREAA